MCSTGHRGVCALRGTHRGRHPGGRWGGRGHVGRGGTPGGGEGEGLWVGPGVRWGCRGVVEKRRLGDGEGELRGGKISEGRGVEGWGRRGTSW